MGTVVGSAFAGVYDPRGTEQGKSLRARLERCLEPDGPAERHDAGPLSIAWTAGVRENRRGDGLACLLDGQIYNVPELASELGIAGGEVADFLARGYASLGTAFLEALRGDFAIVLWDAGAGRGMVARDHLGGRPLHLHRAGEVVVFASEARNISALLPRMPRPDPVAVARWLAPNPVLGGRTLFEGIEPLPPASFLTLGTGEVGARRFWLPRYRPARGITAEEAGAQVRPALELAVKRRAGTRGTTAVLLSGGIDSGGVAGVAMSSLPADSRPTRSYSAVFRRHPQIDESSLIREVASDLGLRATALQLDSGSVIAGALPFIGAWKQLPTTPNLFFLRPLLERAAAERACVLLDGEGGDAVFWYTPLLLAERVRQGRLPSAWSLAGRFPEYGRKTTFGTRLQNLRQWGRRQSFDPSPPTWLTVEQDIEQPAPTVPHGSGPEWWRAHVEGILGPGSQLLHDASRRHGQLSGIEPRHPILDVDLIDLALTFPPELAFDRRYNRPVLREALVGLIPDSVRLRPYKSNFDPVFLDSMRADMPVIESLLLERDAEIAAYTEREGLRRHLASPPSGTGALRAWSRVNLHLVLMECWLRDCAGMEPMPPALLSRLTPSSYSFLDL